MAIADFNGDKILDLAVVGSKGTTQILAGKGDGTFTNGESIPYKTTYGIVAADFNGDGAVDLATSQSTSQGGMPVEGGPLVNVAVLLNTYGATTTAALNNAVVNVANIPSHNLQCSYAGDNNYAASISNLVTENYSQAAAPAYSQLVGIYPPGQQVSINDSTAGASIHFTTDGTGPSLSSTLYNSAITLNQTTTIKAAAFATGYLDSPVSTATYTIQTSGGGSYSLTAPAVSVAKGAAGSSTIQVSTSDGDVGVVTLTCSVTSSPAGAVDLPNCSINKTVTLSSVATSGTATLNVSTTPASSSALARRSSNKGNRWPAIRGSGALLATVILIFCPKSHKRRRLLAVLIGIAFAVGFQACGGGGESKTPIPPSDPGTTPGSYTIAVKGTGSDTAGTSSSTTFTLTVQ